MSISLCHCSDSTFFWHVTLSLLLTLLYFHSARFGCYVWENCPLFPVLFSLGVHSGNQGIFSHKHKPNQTKEMANHAQSPCFKILLHDIQFTLYPHYLDPWLSQMPRYLKLKPISLVFFPCLFLSFTIGSCNLGYLKSPAISIEWPGSTVSSV